MSTNLLVCCSSCSHWFVSWFGWDARMSSVPVRRDSPSTYAFYGALTAFEMLKLNPKDQKWTGVVDSALTKMEKWALASPWNSEHRLSFLKAEQMANGGDYSVGAVSAYGNAARLAKEHGFVNEEALIRERYGTFPRVSGDEASARVQYDEAYNAYMKWGALRKCVEVRKKAD